MTARERGRAFADTQLKALRTTACARLVAAAAPFQAALQSLERRNDAGELRADFYVASRAQLLNERRRAIATATEALQRELTDAQRRAAELAADTVVITPEDFTAMRYASDLLAADPDEGAWVLRDAVEVAAQKDARGFLKLALPHLRALLRKADPATDADPNRAGMLSATLGRAEDALATEFTVGAILITEAAGRMQFQIEQLAEVVAEHGVFEGAPDVRASIAAVDPATARSGLFPDLVVPISAADLQPVLDERREALKAAAEAASAGIT